MSLTSTTRKAERARQAALDEPIDLTRSDCKLMAIQQFTCEYVPQLAINCKPLWRVFQVCGGRSFEVTPLARVNQETGEASIIVSKDDDDGEQHGGRVKVSTTVGKNWHDLHPALS